MPTNVAAVRGGATARWVNWPQCISASMAAFTALKGRIQKRKTYHLQIITFRLQRAAGPYRSANRVLTRRSKKAPLFDQFVGRKQRCGRSAGRLRDRGWSVQRFAIEPGVMVTRSTSATVG